MTVEKSAHSTAGSSDRRKDLDRFSAKSASGTDENPGVGTDARTPAKQGSEQAKLENSLDPASRIAILLGTFETIKAGHSSLCRVIQETAATLERDRKTLREAQANWMEERQKLIDELQREALELDAAWKELESRQRDLESRVAGTQQPMTGNPVPEGHRAASAGGIPGPSSANLDTGPLPGEPAEFDSESMAMQFQQLKREMLKHAKYRS